MEPQFIDPVPDKNLLDYNFEGYRVSLKNTKIESVELVNPVLIVRPNRKRYSLLHARIFDLHNYIIGDRSNSSEHIYYIDKTRSVRKAKYDAIIRKIEFCKLWTFPDQEEVICKDSNTYNPTIKFVSDNLAIASDGIKTFFLLETGDRNSGVKWKTLHSEELLQGKGFFIQDAVLKDLELHALLCSIEHGPKRTYLAVHWITLINESNIWRQKSLKELTVEGDCGYIYLERSCEAIYVASTTSCKFVFDSENIIMDTGDEKRDHITKLDFKWSQDSKYVAVHFLMPDDIKKEDVNVNCTGSYITVQHKNTRLIDGALYSVVHSYLTTMSVSKNLLELTFAKVEEGDEWSSLLRDYDTGRQYVGGIGDNLDDSSDDMDDLEQEFVFNRDPVEQCDYTNSEHQILERLCATSHNITHRWSLGVSPVIITMEPEDRYPPSFGVQYDVDVCIWQPRCESNSIELKHNATLLALGYIQSTTERKKFMSCPSNYEFTVICDMSRHIFLYRQDRIMEASELINRRTGARPKRAEQRSLTALSDDVLGVYAVPLGIYILGETYLMYIEA
ncbi:nudC domain-containing protein 1 [Harmonia axyridis]|uniref:nudC domain-containing protein 1 n=1 Tax=Harmonia axyridis TaxID=115357 RepID=UPI001E278D34|nr:nudC domain-containing protein 1 [Harmonia axyridis]